MQTQQPTQRSNHREENKRESKKKNRAIKQPENNHQNGNKYAPINN